MIDYKSVVVEYDKQDAKFKLSIYTYLNMKNYPMLPPFTVMHTDWPDDDVHIQLLAIALKYYIQASEADLTIVDMLQNIQQERN